MKRSLLKLLPGTLKARIRNLILGYPIHTYTFALAAEDLILLSLLGDLLRTDIRNYPGTYVDVGAYHPVNGSNTYLFYINGWSGINIDPNPGSMALFNKMRPRDINLEVGISATDGQQTYYYIGPDATMNTFSREYLEAHGMLGYVQKEIPLNTRPLAAVLDEYLGARNLDLLCVDTEGYDMQVLLSNDWDRFRPKAICLEFSPSTTIDELPAHPAYSLLTSLGFVAVAKNYITRSVSSVVFADGKLL